MPKLPVLTSIWPDWALRLVTAMAASTTFCSWDWTVAASRPSRVADKVAVSRSCTTSTEPSADNCTTLAGCACAEAAFCAQAPLAQASAVAATTDLTQGRDSCLESLLMRSPFEMKGSSGIQLHAALSLRHAARW